MLKRIVSIILSVAMLASFSAITVFADVTPTYTQDFENYTAEADSGITVVSGAGGKSASDKSIKVDSGSAFTTAQQVFFTAESTYRVVEYMYMPVAYDGSAYVQQSSGHYKVFPSFNADGTVTRQYTQTNTTDGYAKLLDKYNLNEWYHIVFVANVPEGGTKTGTCTIYINGTEVCKDNPISGWTVHGGTANRTFSLYGSGYYDNFKTYSLTAKYTPAFSNSSVASSNENVIVDNDTNTITIKGNNSFSLSDITASSGAQINIIDSSTNLTTVTDTVSTSNIVALEHNDTGIVEYYTIRGTFSVGGKLDEECIYVDSQLFLPDADFSSNNVSRTISYDIMPLGKAGTVKEGFIGVYNNSRFYPGINLLGEAWTFGAYRASSGDSYELTTPIYSFTPGQWYHIDVTTEPLTGESNVENALYLYVNGELVTCLNYNGWDFRENRVWSLTGPAYYDNVQFSESDTKPSISSPATIELISTDANAEVDSAAKTINIKSDIITSAVFTAEGATVAAVDGDSFVTLSATDSISAGDCIAVIYNNTAHVDYYNVVCDNIGDIEFSRSGTDVSASVSFKFQNPDADFDAVLYIVKYENGELAEIKLNDISIKKGIYTSEVYSTDAIAYTDEQNQTVKAFLWDLSYSPIKSGDFAN